MVHMKQVIVVAILGLLVPSVASAAWWNPFSWKKARATTTEIVATTTTDSAYVPPSTGELLRRIAELEDKLAEAQTKLKKLTGTVKPEEEALNKVLEKVSTQTVASPAPKTTPTVGDVAPRIRPAIVLVETASSSASGAFIDSAGRVITSADVMLTFDDKGYVNGVRESATLILSSGAKREARLIGLDEAAGVAIVEATNGSSPASLRPSYHANVASGDTLFVANAPSPKAKGGSTLISAEVVKKSSSNIEMVSTEKPLDQNGVVASASGEFVGFQVPSSCRVLEQGTTCLKYTITVKNTIKDRIPKLLLGMRLFKDKKHATGDEKLIGGKFEGTYQAIAGYGTIDVAYDYVSGKNSFDYFNTKLEEDEHGKITRIYLNKLKIAADNIFKAYEWLKGQSYDLHVFFINEELAIESLGSYQKRITQEIIAYNTARLKDYSAKVDYWSKKKNEYDARLADSSTTNHDYLMAEGALIELEADKLIKEKKKVMDRFSGETVEIF